MTFSLRYTGIRVRDMDKALDFFRNVLGMKLEARIKAPWNKGEFANLRSGDGKHWLELSWYADDSPVAGPYREGDELDHLGFEVDDFQEALGRLERVGYPVRIGPIKAGKWNFAFVPVIDGIWLDVFHIAKAAPRRPRKAVKKKRARSK
jgi:lactoylglutathione lyase